mmetsp:Transcript_16829/g.52653  ORF Transcript_16829/g.52653 Transcript_16829/m.52653 type:complete len:479 (+) Transcript_16829:163-1599(+)
MPTARAWSSRCGLEKERAGACVQGLRLCRHQCANARPRGFQPNPPGGRLSGHSGVRLGARRERPGAGVDLLPLVLQVPHAAHDAHDGQDDRRHRVRERLGGVVGVEGADAEQQGRDADHDGHLGHDRQHDARVGEAQAGQRPAQLAVGLHAPRHLPVAALHGVVPRSHRHEVCVDGPSRNRQGDDLPRRGHQSREEEDHHGVEVQQAPESTVCEHRKAGAEREPPRGPRKGHGAVVQRAEEHPAEEVECREGVERHLQKADKDCSGGRQHCKDREGQAVDHGGQDGQVPLLLVGPCVADDVVHDEERGAQLDGVGELDFAAGGHGRHGPALGTGAPRAAGVLGSRGEGGLGRPPREEPEVVVLDGPLGYRATPGRVRPRSESHRRARGRTQGDGREERQRRGHPAGGRVAAEAPGERVPGCVRGLRALLQQQRPMAEPGLLVALPRPAALGGGEAAQDRLGEGVRGPRAGRRGPARPV